MKIRNGFVSNSSASSFIISRAWVWENQPHLIPYLDDGNGSKAFLDYVEYVVNNIPLDEVEQNCFKKMLVFLNRWEIEQTQDNWDFFCQMDNFDLHYFIRKFLDIKTG
jgi:hypothetical protein